jgi:hypothetical protein
MPATIVHLVGRIYGDLTVIAKRGSNKHRQSIWLCTCICGNQKLVSTKSLRTGHTKSCGCRLRKGTAERMKGNSYNLRHGFAKIKQGPVYRAFTSNRERCNNRNSCWYHLYGGKGITFFDSFGQYWEAIGKDYPGPNHRLKRRNTDLGFDVDGNCFWEPIGTGINGVNYRKRSRTWQARIRVNGQVKHLGEYKTKAQAIQARLAAEQKYIEAHK